MKLKLSAVVDEHGDIHGLYLTIREDAAPIVTHEHFPGIHADYSRFGQLVGIELTGLSENRTAFELREVEAVVDLDTIIVPAAESIQTSLPPAGDQPSGLDLAAEAELTADEIMAREG